MNKFIQDKDNLLILNLIIRMDKKKRKTIRITKKYLNI
jgi:hypothetical protein